MGKSNNEALDSIVDQMDDVAVEGLSLIWGSLLLSVWLYDLITLMS